MKRNQQAQRGTVVITGTSRGIGYHLARRFLAEGYGVLGISRTETPIEDPRFRSVKADLSDLGQVAGLREVLSGAQVVGLINNAGIHGAIGSLEEVPLEGWLKAFSVNLFGAAALTRLCIPDLRRRQGFIIFLSGGGSGFPRPRFSAYGVSKTAVVRLSEVLAQELAPEVLVYCVAPGPNPTGLLEEAIRAGTVVKEGEMVNFGYVERLCMFLAQNRNPRFSGRFIHVKDDYSTWGDRVLAEDAYTLRRVKP
jgi:NAD(P)-dependent dehydrogenase (short-subunit alcohol dehydrogenase family)